mmetsp:Transcript_8167/g.24468  ORF Transcript_8167/g.24468 Transcript_8167/m.24468 type:complete len:226 (+) Transcript_8167:270-947(+)
MSSSATSSAPRANAQSAPGSTDCTTARQPASTLPLSPPRPSRSARTKTSTESQLCCSWAARSARSASGRQPSASATEPSARRRLKAAAVTASSMSSSEKSGSSSRHLAKQRKLRTSSQFSTTSPAVRGRVPGRTPASGPSVGAQPPPSHFVPVGSSRAAMARRPTSSSSKSSRSIIVASAGRTTRFSRNTRRNLWARSNVRQRCTGMSLAEAQGPSGRSFCRAAR